LNEDVNDFAKFLSDHHLIDPTIITKKDSEEGFVNRLRLQKLVFIAQESFGLNFGFTYSIYRYGPYSPQLANYYFSGDFGFAPLWYTLPDSFDQTRFLSLVSGKDEPWLEIAATLIDSKKFYSSKEEILEAVNRIKPKYDCESIKSIYDELSKYQIMDCL
jgi:uncharacterized protein YwgA